MEPKENCKLQLTFDRPGFNFAIGNIIGLGNGINRCKNYTPINSISRAYDVVNSEVKSGTNCNSLGCEEKGKIAEAIVNFLVELRL